jgi:hypothetical protein
LLGDGFRVLDKSISVEQQGRAAQCHLPWNAISTNGSWRGIAAVCPDGNPLNRILSVTLTSTDAGECGCCLSKLPLDKAKLLVGVHCASTDTNRGIDWAHGKTATAL